MAPLEPIRFLGCGNGCEETAPGIMYMLVGRENIEEGYQLCARGAVCCACPAHALLRPLDSLSNRSIRSTSCCSVIEATDFENSWAKQFSLSDVKEWLVCAKAMRDGRWRCSLPLLHSTLTSSAIPQLLAAHLAQENEWGLVKSEALIIDSKSGPLAEAFRYAQADAEFTSCGGLVLRSTFVHKDEEYRQEVQLRCVCRLLRPAGKTCSMQILSWGMLIAPPSMPCSCPAQVAARGRPGALTPGSLHHLHHARHRLLQLS